MPDETSPPAELAALQAAGDDRREVLGRVFDAHRKRLLKMIHVRMDPRVKARFGASDVLQEAFLEVTDRVDDYLADPRLPFFLWLRIITAQRLIRLHRMHLGAKRRDVRRQIGMDGGAFPAATSIALLDELVARGTTPTQALVRASHRDRVLRALDEMKDDDREVLVLRHFEELSNVEAARELGIGEAAASKRHIRALRRLEEILGPETG